MVLEAKLFIIRRSIKVWILCVCVKHHVITEPKNSLAPTSGRFLSNSYRPLGPWVEHAHRVSFRSNSVNLVKLVLKLVWPCGHVFWDTRMSSPSIVPLWTKMLHTNFEVDRTNGCLVIAIYMFFLSYSAPKWQAAHFFYWPKIELIHMCTSLVMIFISFKIYTSSNIWLTLA